MTIIIYRLGVAVASFKTDDQTVFTYQLMGEHKIAADFICTSPLSIQIGDYIVWQNENYYINTVPGCIKSGSNYFEYSISFESELYKLYNKKFMDEGAQTFSYYGTASDLIDLVVDNINSIDSGWSAGTIDDTDPVLINFDNVTCRDALTQIAQQFGLEFYLSGKTINLVALAGNDTTITLEYGKDNGLYQLSRKPIDDLNIVTRAYGFGGSKNLDFNYRDGSKQLVFNERFLEENTSVYGIREGSVVFDDIYPHRDGTISGVDASDRTTVIDSSLDFDINAQLLEGVTAQIVFNTGDLGGNQFDIISYDAASKTIKFKANIDSNNYTLPNDIEKPQVNDSYTLVNIKMPQSYIDSAEAELKTRTQAYLDQNCQPRPAYDLTIDRFNAQKKAIAFNAGDKITIVDDSLGVNAKIRASAISYPLIDPFQITATIADTIPYTVQEKLIAKAVTNTKVIREVDRTRSEASRINALRYRQLQGLVFDPDGYFDTSHIKPESIETLMLAVGAKSQDFNLSGILIVPNYQGDSSVLIITPGELIHHEISIDGLGYIWELPLAQFTELDPSKAYYVYAKCSQTELTGTWEISETPKKVDDEAGYWVFNLGILYALAGSGRDFAFTNGMTYISGQNITSGRIQDISGVNYFDLTEGIFNMGEPASGVDFNISNPGKWTVRGGIVQNQGGDKGYIPLPRGAYNAGATYYPGDIVTYSGSSFRCIATGSISGVTPSDDGVNWEIYASKGDQGPQGAQGQQGIQGIQGETGDQGIQGPAGSNGQTSYFHIKYSPNADGNPMTETPDTFIGTYVDFSPTDSSDYADYSWARFQGLQGDQGTQGIPGTNGADGQTSYLHIKYSDDGGTTFTANSGETPGQWIGQYVDFIQADSNTPSDYSWAKIKGDKGDTGATGSDGADGSDGNWVEIRFAKNGSLTTPPALTNTDASPTGWTTTPPSTGVLEYLWMTNATKTTAGALVGIWSAPVRVKGDVGATGATGAKGDKGDQGPIGPALSYAGVYASGTSYHGGSDRVEVVQYSGSYYITRVDAGDFSGVLPTNTSKWNGIGAQFDSIATGLILAQLAYIENLVVGRLSTSADSAKPRIVAQAGEIDVFDVDVPIDEETTAKAMIRIGKGAGIMSNAPDGKPGIGLRDTAGDSSYTEVSSEGIFTNGSGIEWISAIAGILSNAGLASLLTVRNADSDGISAAIVGVDQTTSGNSKSYAGYFDGDVKITKTLKGLKVPVTPIATTQTLTEDDCSIIAYSGATIYLPASPLEGQTYFIHRVSGTFNLMGNGNNIISGTTSQASITPDFSVIVQWTTDGWRRMDANH